MDILLLRFGLQLRFFGRVRVRLRVSSKVYIPIFYFILYFTLFYNNKNKVELKMYLFIWGHPLIHWRFIYFGSRKLGTQYICTMVISFNIFFLLHSTHLSLLHIIIYHSYFTIIWFQKLNIQLYLFSIFSFLFYIYMSIIVTS